MQDLLGLVEVALDRSPGGAEQDQQGAVDVFWEYAQAWNAAEGFTRRLREAVDEREEVGRVMDPEWRHRLQSQGKKQLLLLEAGHAGRHRVDVHAETGRHCLQADAVGTRPRLVADEEFTQDAEVELVDLGAPHAASPGPRYFNEPRRFSRSHSRSGARSKRGGDASSGMAPRLLMVLLVLGAALAGCAGQDKAGNPPAESGGNPLLPWADQEFRTDGPFSHVSTPGPFDILTDERVALQSDLDGVDIQIGFVRPDTAEPVPVIAMSTWYLADVSRVAVRDACGDVREPRRGMCAMDAAFLVDNFVPHGYAVAIINARGLGG